LDKLLQELAEMGLRQDEIWLEFQQLPDWELPHNINARLRSLNNASLETVARFIGPEGSTGQRWFPMEKALVPLLHQAIPLRQGLTRCWAVPREYLSESRQWDASPEELRIIVERMGALLGMPLCLGGEPHQQPAFDLTLYEADGTLSLPRFTDWFIKNKYWVKSLRCRECRHYGSCSGLHINYVRNYGFRVMTPFKDA
jgi:hypothetical protein